MTLNKYQQLAFKTAIYGEENKIAYCILGLTGEAGEVANKYKKILRDKGGEMKPSEQCSLALEVGDVLWYVAALAKELGFSLEDLASSNLNKLKARQETNTIMDIGDNRKIMNTYE